MRVLLGLILITACTLADKHDNRRNKLPFVADAVGNSLPPPATVPATVGSPVNLLTPDRYEFYTFDESGELVKRLMTLEEIQAIVAAGEENESLVTFANENSPTVSFNVHQAPYTKIHNVVTNVQNVLKAQMEAHKNKPHIQPTLDTPDVSDSWSLILPSVFGNTGVDIVLDKASGSVTTPETEIIEENIEDDENSLSKEGNHQVLASSIMPLDENIVITEKTIPQVTTTTTSTTTTTTTHKPSTKPTITTPRPTTTTPKPTTPKPTTPKPTTPKPTTPKSTTPKSTTPIPIAATTKPTTVAPKFTTTTSKPTTTKVITTSSKRPLTSTSKKPLQTSANVFQTKITTKLHPTLTTFQPTTIKPVIRTTHKITAVKLETTTKKEFGSVSTPTADEKINVQIHPNSNVVSSTEKNEIEFERISTFIPVSTVNYVSERTTQKPVVSTKLPFVATSTTVKRYISTTTEVPTTQTIKLQPLGTTFNPIVSTEKSNIDQKINNTTITTQSVSPSTTVSSTEFLSADKVNLPINVNENTNSNLPLFDVAQSISQIASDLGSSYQPIPTTNNLLDNSNESQLNLESKENLDIDIPSANRNDTDLKTPEIKDKNDDNFIKISTIDPHNINKVPPEENITSTNLTDTKNSTTENSGLIKNNISLDNLHKLELTSTPLTTELTTIDPILTESMGDLLSQVVNQAPTIVDSDKQEEEIPATFEENQTTTTVGNIEDIEEITSGISLKVKKDTSTTTEKTMELVSEKEISKLSESVFKNDLNEQTVAEKENSEKNPKPNEIVMIVNETDINNLIHTSDFNNKTDSSVNISENSFNETKEALVPIYIETKKEEHKEISKTKNDSETLKPGLDNEYRIETTTVLSDLNLDGKIVISNKIIPPTINKIILNDKTNSVNSNSKLPEPLPKVDDFRKKIQKVNMDEEELIRHRNNSWKLIPTLSPPKINEISKDKVKLENQHTNENNDSKDIVLEFSNENQGLEVTTKDLGEDIAKFSELSNELAFRYWSIIIDDIDKRRSFVFSPYSTFSMLAMIFMGAKGATSGEMNEILKLDDMFTFNPHFALKNISDSIETTPHSGVAVSAFARELYSDRNRGKILTFYKERAQHFYNGHVEEINFKLISDIIRRRTNLLVKRYTWGKMPEYMKTNNIVMQPPLAAFTANIFQTDCSGTSVDGRDGEMYFVVSPNVRQRRLVPVPAVVYKKGFLAGYEPVLDVTVAALGNTNTIVSTLFLMPGQQGNVVHADDLEKLEQRLLESIPTTPTWNRVLRSLLPRTGLELQIPRFSHKSTFNASLTLKKMGLKDLFDSEHADLGGLNGPSKDLYLSDMVQLNTFVTCGEGVIGEQHHIEEYPETLSVAQRRRTRWLNDWDEPRDYQRAFHDPHDISDAMHLPLHLRPRQARLPARSNQPARLKFDRPFLYFVRHNPSGMILYFGRYNPRLLP